jgi:DnaJ-class molecular chaperone
VTTRWQLQMERFAASPKGQEQLVCPTCSGSGEVEVRPFRLYGPMATSEPCPTCHGNETVPRWYLREKRLERAAEQLQEEAT